MSPTDAIAALERLRKEIAQRHRAAVWTFGPGRPERVQLEEIIAAIDRAITCLIRH